MGVVLDQVHVQESQGELVPPEIIDAINDFKRGLQDRETAQMAEMARRWRDVEISLENRAVEAAANAVRLRQDGPLTRASLIRAERTELLLQQARTELLRYADYATPLITNEQRNLLNLAIEHSQEALSIAGGRVVPSFAVLATRNIENLVGAAGNGSPLRSLLENTYGFGADGILREMISGVAIGDNPRTIARRVVRDGFSDSLNHMMMVARTEQLRIYRETSRQYYTESEVVRGYQRLSARDTRVCVGCLMADGRFYELSVVFQEHPQGRCALVPVLNDAPLWDFQDGHDWLLEQDPVTQIEIMGQGRWDAWQAGRFNLRQMETLRRNNVWGDSIQPTPLRELMRGRGGIRRPPIPPPSTPRGRPFTEDNFPSDLNRLEVERNLGGSTGAQLLRDPVDGRRYVRKVGANADHLLEEIAADRAYQALGVNVPKLHVYNTPDGPVKLAEFIEGDLLSDLRRNNRRAYRKALTQMRKDFAADALLGNWDVAGLDFDNIIVDRNGRVWRIDNGGALRRRAQGALKPVWNQYTDEIWTLRDQSINRQTAEIFGDLNYDQITKQMRRVTKKSNREALIASLPGDLRPLMESRVETMRDLVRISSTLSKDAWMLDYIDDFSRHSIGIRKAGIVDRFPERLTRRGVRMIDQDGKEWDDLRAFGRSSVIADFDNYLAANGGDYSLIGNWARRQASSSWNDIPQAFKYRYATARTVDLSEYWWNKGGVERAKRNYEKSIGFVGENALLETTSAWHAFNYEFMRNVKFPRNNTTRGQVRLIRTEDIDVMRSSGLSRGDRDVVMMRGPVESTSIYETVRVGGSEETIQIVPHHRIFGNYFFERSPGFDQGMFLGDHENEFIAMLEGVRFDYERN